MKRKIRLAIVSGILHQTLGGPTVVLGRHFHALRREMDVTVFGVAEPWQREAVEHALPGCHIFPLTWPRRWFRGAGLTEALRTALVAYDVVHAHMLLDHPVWAAWRVARQTGKPFIITPHGSLMAPWRYQTGHKRLYRRLILDTMLQETTFLHVLNTQEARACRQAGVTTPVRVIPNGLEDIEFQRTNDATLARKRWPMLANRRILLYLGRLWEGKGVGDLVEAWATLAGEPCATSWLLVLAGPDYRGYQKRLLAQLEKQGMPHDTTGQGRVFLTGEVTGQAKADLWTLATGFILPSHSEGLSSALLEAMAAGLPSVYSRACHFPELAHAMGGLEVPVGSEGIRDGILKLLHMSTTDRIQMGLRARELAQKRFTMTQVASGLHAMYREALQRPPTPHHPAGIRRDTPCP